MYKYTKLSEGFTRNLMSPVSYAVLVRIYYLARVKTDMRTSYRTVLQEHYKYSQPNLDTHITTTHAAKIDSIDERVQREGLLPISSCAEFTSGRPASGKVGELRAPAVRGLASTATTQAARQRAKTTLTDPQTTHTAGILIDSSEASF